MNSRRYPRGIWYEAPAKRFRVRLYRNKVSHLEGYFPTENEAVEALQRLKARLMQIPKRPRSFVREAPAPTFAALSRSLHEDINPKTFH